MSTILSELDKRKKLDELMAHFDTAMLVTKTGDGRLRSRPLAVAKREAEAALYFSTAIDSAKIRELEGDPQVNVVMQSSRRFVSLTGRAHVSRDRNLIEKLWSDSWKVWFPGGKDDPSLALVVVEPDEASYWDSSGTEGIRLLFEMARAYVTHEKPPSDRDERRTAHVKL